MGTRFKRRKRTEEPKDDGCYRPGGEPHPTKGYFDDLEELDERLNSIDPEEKRSIIENHNDARNMIAKKRKREKIEELDPDKIEEECMQGLVKRRVMELAEPCPYDIGTDEYFEWVCNEIVKNTPHEGNRPFIPMEQWEEKHHITEKVKQMLELALHGKSINEICMEIGVPKFKLERMAHQNPTLAKALVMAKDISQAWWDKIGRQNVHNKDFNTNLWKASVSQRFPDVGVDREKERVVQKVQNNIFMDKESKIDISFLDTDQLEALDQLHRMIQKKEANGELRDPMHVEHKVPNIFPRQLK